MNVKGIMPIIGSNFATKKIESKKVFTEKQDEINLSTKKEKKDFKTKAKEFFQKAKSAFIVIGASLVTGLTVFATMKSKNDKIKEECEKLQQKFDDIVLPQDIQEKINEKMDKLNGAQLSYSPTTRIEVSSSASKGYVNKNPITVLPEKYEKPNLRTDAKNLNYPEFVVGKPYHFEFPSSSEVKLSFDDSPVKSQPRTLTTVSESYADSLLWDNDKIARDLIQNFYDGHGQTLDGVKLDVQPNEDGKYTVRISGKSTFSPDKAILLGESSKKDNANAAGNYGEGLKMVVLKLLREKGADEVNIAANNWNVNWNFEDSGFGKKVLAYKLDEVKPIDGNYIEFTTDNVGFIKSITKSFDRFYHYNNPAFSNPDFENDSMGIKLLEKVEKGKFYIAGQAFEVDGNYDGLDLMNIYIKKKPPQKYKGEYIFDPSRDRTSLNKYNLEALGKWVVSKENMSKEDTIKLLHSLQEYWDVGTMSFNHFTIGTSFISGVYEGAKDRDDINIKFPSDKYVAYDWGVSNGLQDMYKKAGYKICSTYFKYMGMPSIDTLVEETRKHKPLEPTESEKNKILIIKEAIQLLSPVLKEEGLFSDEELDTKIFIYDKSSEVESKAYEDVAGEAIIDKGKSKGFWLDRTYMKEQKFSTLLSTSLHELTHKYGGDESERFSYKLTDVMQKVFEAINSNPNLATQLKVLEQAWEAQK